MFGYGGCRTIIVVVAGIGKDSSRLLLYRLFPTGHWSAEEIIEMRGRYQQVELAIDLHKYSRERNVSYFGVYLFLSSCISVPTVVHLPQLVGIVYLHELFGPEIERPNDNR